MIEPPFRVDNTDDDDGNIVEIQSGPTITSSEGMRNT